jgi:NitT/TauT family transport system ATP-binding protein
VHYNDTPVAGPPEGVAFVFQDYSASLLPWRSVAKNVELGLESTMPAKPRRELVRETLNLVGLSERADDYPWRLSGGMQQRVQIARALAMRPTALLMDEPFGALDAMTKGQLQDELLRLHEVTGATIVFVTHDTEEAVYLSDRIIALVGSPSNVGREIEVSLPRPREQMSTRETPRYLELRRLTHAAVHLDGTESP